jgi:hypothetical protein
MSHALTVACKASAMIEAYLLTLPETTGLVNVENDPVYRKKDIDLLWSTKQEAKVSEYSIEIKGDRYYTTGNYFFETISNEEKGTSGCFLYTEADFIYYYFLEQRELHILPMPETRKWFIENMNRFKERKTSTLIKAANYYITVGRIVPRAIVREEVPCVKIIAI